jgi:predicted RNase H-like nuclease (RuvC/YqgF family)
LTVELDGIIRDNEELSKRVTQQLKKIEELQESKECEVETLNAQLTERDLMIEELKNQLGESQNVRKSTIASEISLSPCICSEPLYIVNFRLVLTTKLFS